MIKKYAVLLTVTSVIILLPIIAGIILWPSLPNTIPSHWDANGNIDESTPIRENNEEHISKIDEDNLRFIAEELKITYIRRLTSEKEINKADNYIDSSISYERGNSESGSYEDLYWIAMLGAIGLMLWDFYGILAVLLLERKAVK